MSTEEFLKDKSSNFHLELLRYYYMMADKKEQKKQKDTDILFFEFPEGRYSIKFEDLKERANEEAVALLERNNITQPNQ